jgi:hypothetical protein
VALGLNTGFLREGEEPPVAVAGVHGVAEGAGRRLRGGASQAHSGNVGIFFSTPFLPVLLRQPCTGRRTETY